jgi:hypothetical protein
MLHPGSIYTATIHSDEGSPLRMPRLPEAPISRYEPEQWCYIDRRSDEPYTNHACDQHDVRIVWPKKVKA